MSSDAGFVRVTFGHGRRHLSTTALDALDVERRIRADIRGRSVPTEGAWRAIVSIDDERIEYRAYRRSDGTVHVGTYYPL